MGSGDVIVALHAILCAPSAVGEVREGRLAKLVLFEFQ